MSETVTQTQQAFTFALIRFMSIHWNQLSDKEFINWLIWYQTVTHVQRSYNALLVQFNFLYYDVLKLKMYFKVHSDTGLRTPSTRDDAACIEESERYKALL